MLIVEVETLGKRGVISNMSKKFALILALVAIVIISALPTAQAQYGGEDIVLPATGSYLATYGCSDYLTTPADAVMLPIQFTGMNVGEEYEIEVLYEDVFELTDPHQHIRHQQIPGRSDFTFWLLGFEYELNTGTATAALPGGDTYKSFTVFLNEASGGAVIKTAVIDLDCATGEVLFTSVVP